MTVPCCTAGSWTASGAACACGFAAAGASAVSASGGVPSVTGVSFSLFVIYLSYQSGERLGGEVHHGYDARIVQACRADHHDVADHEPIRSEIGRGDKRRTRQLDKLIPRPADNGGHAAVVRPVDKLRHVTIGFQLCVQVDREMVG